MSKTMCFTTCIRSMKTTLRPQARMLVILLLLLLPFLPSGGKSVSVQGNEALLCRLDSILLNHFVLVKEKENRIDRLRESLSRARTSSDRLAILRQLYEEYLVYDSDSALYYATESRRLAGEIAPDDYNLQTEWKLNQAFIHTVQGLYDQTLALVGDIDKDRLDTETKAEYFNTLAYLYSMRGVYLNRNQALWEEEIRKSNQYRDSIRQLMQMAMDTRGDFS